LRSPVRGMFWMLYMVVDVWSRKIVAARVHDREADGLAAALLEDAYRREGVRPGQLGLHSDNGAAMKGQTLLVKLRDLGVASTFSPPPHQRRQPVLRGAIPYDEVPAQLPRPGVPVGAGSPGLGRRIRALVQRRPPAQRDPLRDAVGTPRPARGRNSREPSSGLRGGQSTGAASMVGSDSQLDAHPGRQPQPAPAPVETCPSRPYAPTRGRAQGGSRAAVRRRRVCERTLDPPEHSPTIAPPDGGGDLRSGSTFRRQLP
jgi:hypothetical protein